MSKKIYCNSANFSFGVFDFVISLKTAISGENETPDDVTSLIMSPQHAKVFAQVLIEQVRIYEDQFGEIMLPENHPIKTSCS